jgi:hypothetical protein
MPFLKTWKTDSNLATNYFSRWSGWKVFSKNRSQLKYSDPKKFSASLSSDRRTFFEHSGIDGEFDYDIARPWNKWWNKFLTQQLNNYSMVKVQSFCL